MATTMSPHSPARNQQEEQGHGNAILVGAGILTLSAAGWLWWQRTHQHQAVPPPAPTPTPTPTPTPVAVCSVRPGPSSTDSQRAQYGELWQLGVPVWTLDSGGGIVHLGNATAPYGSPLQGVGPPLTLPSPHWFGRNVTVRPFNWQGSQAFISTVDVQGC